MVTRMTAKDTVSAKLGQRRYQNMTTGQRWWVNNRQAALFEGAVLSEKTVLDTARAGVLMDIQKSGVVHSR